VGMALSPKSSYSLELSEFIGKRCLVEKKERPGSPDRARLDAE
jgi:hypothetical protein